MRKTLIIAGALLFFSSGCTASGRTASSPPPQPQHTPASEPSSAERDANTPPCSRWISGKQAQNIIESGGLLLDVRTPDEFEEEHLHGAVNINVEELQDRLEELPLDKEIVVYCHSGKRAHRAALLLKKEGRTVSEIGSMSQWEKDAPAGCSK